MRIGRRRYPPGGTDAGPRSGLPFAHGRASGSANGARGRPAAGGRLAAAGAGRGRIPTGDRRGHRPRRRRPASRRGPAQSGCTPELAARILVVTDVVVSAASSSWPGRSAGSSRWPTSTADSRGAIDELPAIWVEGELCELSRHDRWATVFLTLKDPGEGAIAAGDDGPLGLRPPEPAARERDARARVGPRHASSSAAASSRCAPTASSPPATARCSRASRRRAAGSTPTASSTPTRKRPLPFWPTAGSA